MIFAFKASGIKCSLFVIVCFSLNGILAIPSFAEGQEQYLLITNESLEERFQPLVDRRCSQGMDGILITVEDINDSTLYSGKDIQEKIRSCIQSYYDPGQTMFLVLGGDEHTVPARYCDTIGDTNAAPVDLYYADMDGTQWDADGNGTYGQITDIGLAELTPEVCFGRIPVNKPEEVEAYVSKIFRYESIDPNEFEDSLLLFSGSGFDECYEGPSRPPGYRDHDPVSFKEVQMTDVFLNIIQPFWQSGRLVKFFDTNTDWDVDRFGDFDLTRENVLNTLNRGFSYIYYWQHSNYTRWSWIDEHRHYGINLEQAYSLNNSLPSIIFARGCGTGKYDAKVAEKSLCEAFISNPNGGAVIMFAHTRSTGGSPHWDQIMRNMFQESHRTVGEAYRACLNVLAPQKKVWNQYVFLLLGDPALALHRQTRRTLQLFSPKGNEVIDAESDLFVRWNAGGSFSPEETVFLEYSDDDGETWRRIPEANDLPYNTGLFTWSHCPLPNGNTYRIRILSTQNPDLFSESSKSFTIGDIGWLAVKSLPLYNIRIDGTHSNQTEFTCSAIRNESFRLIAPEIWQIPRPHRPTKKDTLQFSGWLDANGILISDSNEYEFVFDHDTTITALYNYPGEGMKYYINDAIADNGIAPGNNDNDGLLPDTPMASIQMLLDRYPKIGHEDIVYISDGYFNENLYIDSVHTGVTLQGAGYDRTIIDGGQIDSCMELGNGVVCHLAHLGFENGKGTVHGGALQLGIGNVKCTIRNCRFENNTAPGRGGAIYLSKSPALIGLEVYDSVFIRNHGNGGAMFTAKDARAEFHDCIFLENTANQGGAFQIQVESSIDFENCVFEDNSSEDVGGTIALHGNSLVSIKECVFEGNSTKDYGGAIVLYDDSNASIEQSNFTSNSSNYGGAITIFDNATISVSQSEFISNKGVKGGVFYFYSRGRNKHAKLRISHSIFEGNYTSFKAGVLWCRGEPSDEVIIHNCTFFGNRASNDGGVVVAINMPMTITNSIIWGNSNQQINLFDDSVVSYSNIEQSFQGFHNISENPLFFLDGFLSDNGTPENENDDFWVPGDYHLQSQTGRWDQLLDEWVFDSMHSPCIDMGDPNSLIADEPSPHGNRINMGAYGGTVEASKSQ